MLPVPSDHRGMSSEDSFRNIFIWRRRAPKFTTFRINSLVTTPSNFIQHLEKSLAELSANRASNGLDSILPPLWTHPLIPEVVGFGCWQRESNLPRYDLEVIVDQACGAAVLRGSHVFVPGVIGLLREAKVGDPVSIYANTGKASKKGWTQKLSESEKYFVGNGLLLMDRKAIFSDDSINHGIAVLVTDNESGCPSLPTESISCGMAVMQNLPSIVCGRVLDPQPREIILDMCAAPGNKTTHLAALMENKGIIIALDRSASRISKLRKLCEELSVTNVKSYVVNSVHAVDLDKTPPANGEGSLQPVISGPPFPPFSFDRILLDAPCSGLGQRPRLEQIDSKHVASFPPLQKRLFETAVKLLKPGGIMVYSTCTVVIDENEAVVRWALDQFPCLKLLPAEPRIVSNARNLDVCEGSYLSVSEINCVQKFMPSVNMPMDGNVCEEDTIGFFVARFQKLM